MPRETCSFPGCERGKQSAIGLCNGHWQQYKKGKELTPITPRAPRSPNGVNRKDSPEPCTFPDCRNLQGGGHGLCPGHNAQRRKGKELTPLRDHTFIGGATCGWEDCDRDVYSRGLCRKHYDLDRRGNLLT
jgi:hypothetical protein